MTTSSVTAPSSIIKPPSPHKPHSTLSSLLFHFFFANLTAALTSNSIVYFSFLKIYIKGNMQYVGFFLAFFLTKHIYKFHPVCRCGWRLTIFITA